MADDLFDDASRLVTFGFLPVIRDLGREGKGEIDIAHETLEVRPVYGAHQVSDILMFQHPYLPGSPKGPSGQGVGDLDNLMAEVPCEYKVPIEDKEVCLDVEEPECYVTVAERGERVGHIQ